MRQVEGNWFAGMQQVMQNCAAELASCCSYAAGLQDPHPGCRQAAGLKVLAGELQQQPSVLHLGCWSSCPAARLSRHMSCCCTLQDNSSRFVSNMQQLQDSVTKYVAAIDQQVTCVGCGGLASAPCRRLC
jgi:hypothetical protein